MENSRKSRLFLYLKGIAMGAADVVPGVSGGTIALITGIYQELIDTIKGVDLSVLKILLKGDIKGFWSKLNGTFLVTLFAGIATSVLLISSGMIYLLKNYPEQLWGFFLGLIIASAWLVGKKVTQWNASNIASLVVGIIAAYFICSATPAQTSEELWFVFLAGSIAICAMILPGISGSFILILFGKYEFILGAIKDMNFTVIATFGLGCIVGILSFSRLLSWLFKSYHNLTIALLTGFMIGSLYKVWPWKNTLETYVDRHGEIKPLIQENMIPSTWNSPELMTVGLAIFGLAFVIILDLVASSKPEK